MGLIEKRKMKELQDKTVPERTAELAEITGAAIQYDVKWDSFADDLEALNFFDNLAFHRINMAFRSICIDDMSKDAVKEGVTTISLENVKESADKSISFAGGVLEMRGAYGQHLDGVIHENEIQKVLEAGL
jgi:hypothetical protein